MICYKEHLYTFKKSTQQSYRAAKDGKDKICDDTVDDSGSLYGIDLQK